MRGVFEIAEWVSKRLDEAGYRHCLIGGVALQAWGEPRVTGDVDLSVLIGFGDETRQIERLLNLIPRRGDQPLDHAVANRFSFASHLLASGSTSVWQGFRTRRPFWSEAWSASSYPAKRYALQGLKTW